MNRFAVIGQPISHSLSPFIHQQFARQCLIELQYDRVEISPTQCVQWVSEFFANNGSGLNVTLPLKETVLMAAHVIHPRAQKAKAANTLWKHHDRIHADNTDGTGFLRDLERHIQLKDCRILILGAGGATRGILGPLLESGIASITVANRSESRVQALKNDFPELEQLQWGQMGGHFDVIINATAADHARSVLPLQANRFQGTPFVYDLSYCREGTTPFVHQCHSFGWPGVDGLGMLVEQAAESFYLWHGRHPKTESLLHMLRA